jgi:hypothetical protein
MSARVVALIAVGRIPGRQSPAHSMSFDSPPSAERTETCIEISERGYRCVIMTGSKVCRILAPTSCSRLKVSCLPSPPQLEREDIPITSTLLRTTRLCPRNNSNFNTNHSLVWMTITSRLRFPRSINYHLDRSESLGDGS